MKFFLLKHFHCQELWLASKPNSMLSSETLLNILDASGGNWQDHFAHKERMADSVTCMATVQDAVWVGTSQVINVPALWLHGQLYTYQISR